MIHQASNVTANAYVSAPVRRALCVVMVDADFGPNVDCVLVSCLDRQPFFSNVSLLGDRGLGSFV